MQPIQTLTLGQIAIPLILAILGSSVVAAWVTARSAFRLKQTDYVEKIGSEVRQDLREELDASEEIVAALREELSSQRRLLDRVVDNLNPVARNVARLCNTVRNLLPCSKRHMADDVLSDLRRLLELLGEIEAAQRLDDVQAAGDDASLPPATGPPGGAPGADPVAGGA